MIEQNINIKKDNSIGYEGHVKVSLVQDGVVLNTKEYHNTGKLPLFRFVVDCLKGSYSDAELNRPKFIQLFTAGADGGSVPSSDTVESYFSQDSRIKTPQKIIYQGTPLTEYIEKTTDIPEDEAKITFKFMVPYTQLTDINDINLFALYSQSNYNSTLHPSAYFLLTKLVGTTSELSTLIDTTSISMNSNYSVYIQWTMIIKDNN
jgi:hypothetical protein